VVGVPDCDAVQLKIKDRIKNNIFMEYSVPRNKELMRVFKDLEMVEYLGSGVPRILRKYPRSVFIFTPNFIRIIFPFEKSLDDSQTTLTDQATDQADRLERVFQFCTVPRSRMEIQEFLGLKHRRSFKETVLQPLLESGLLIQTIPDKPSSPKQQYIATSKNKGNE